MLADCSDYDEVVRTVEYYAEYRGMFEGVGTGPGEKTLEDKFFEHEVRHLVGHGGGQRKRGWGCVCRERGREGGKGEREKRETERESVCCLGGIRS